MLSNPQTVLQQRQRLHRRQNSTPTTPYEAMKVPIIPAPGLQRHNSHRRGQSLDQRSPIRRPRSVYEGVSITNKGSIFEQQILREAQQQRLQRPGQQTQSHIPQCGLPMDNTDFQRMSMPMTQSIYTDQAIMNAPLQSPGNTNYEIGRGIELPMGGAYEMVGLGLDENANNHYFQQSHHQLYDMNDGMGMDMRRMSQPDLQDFGQRPMTPLQQMNNSELSR